MIALDNTTRKLQAVLAGPPAATNPKAVVVFYDVPREKKESSEDYPRRTQLATLNGATHVDICDAPSRSDVVRCIEHICIFNADSGALTISVKIDESGTKYTLKQHAVTNPNSLIYEHGAGWQVL